jgi:membrane protease subunit HflK
VAVLLGLYLASGFYVVNADERGVVRRFGAVSARVGPGMHYRIPWPVDRVDVLKTTSVMKIEVGAGVSDGQLQTAGMELLTGDTNLLSVALVLQYIIRDPSDFLLQIEQPQVLLGNIARSILTEAVVSMPIDEVLTTGRLAIQTKVKIQTQEILDRYRSGIEITSVSIMNMTLDRAVAQAFEDVTDAMADREKMRNEALAYMNDLIPRARGEAQGAVSDAQNYRERHVAEAVGNTDRFLALLREYEKAPDITRARLYLEAMERTLPKVKMYVIDSQNGRVPLNLRVTSP